MDILKQLGIDNTLWIQLGFFMVSYFFLATFIFKPYRKNLEFRKNKTTGASQEAGKLVADTDRLAMEYEGKIKNQNEQALELFNRIKSEGKKEEQKIVLEARTRAEKILKEANNQIAQEILAARTQIEKTVPHLSELTASRLLGRDL